MLIGSRAGIGHLTDGFGHAALNKEAGRQQLYAAGIGRDDLVPESIAPEMLIGTGRGDDLCVSTVVKVQVMMMVEGIVGCDVIVVTDDLQNADQYTQQHTHIVWHIRQTELHDSCSLHLSEVP